MRNQVTKYNTFYINCKVYSSIQPILVKNISFGNFMFNITNY